ncbi:TIGR00341 family protein, partial [Halobium palmae]
GIALAWGYPMAAAGSAVLVLVNVLSINLAALAVLWYSGYRPGRWFETDTARAALVKRGAVLVVAIAVLSLFLGGVTYNSYEDATFEEVVREDVEGVLNASYPQTSLVSLELAGEEAAVLGHPDHVVVTVGVPPGDVPTGLAAEFDEVVSERTNRDVTVEVRYVVVENTRLAGNATSGANVT